MLNKSKLVAVSLLFATLLVGVAVGTAVSAVWAGGERDARRGRERMSYTERLQQELDLTPLQRESVSVILGRRQHAMRDIWRQMEPRFDTLRHQIRRDILAQLDPEQQEKFRALIARSDSLRAAREQREQNRGTNEHRK